MGTRQVLLLAVAGGIGILTCPFGTAAGQLRPEVTLISLPGELPYSVEDVHGVLKPDPGLRLLGVRVVFKDSGDLSQVRLDQATLRDDAGTAHEAIGFAPVAIRMLLPFDAVRQFSGGLYSEGSPEAGSSYMSSRMRGPVEFSRKGPAGTSFILVYQIPPDKKTLILALPGQSPVTLTMP